MDAVNVKLKYATKAFPRTHGTYWQQLGYDRDVDFAQLLLNCCKLQCINASSHCFTVYSNRDLKRARHVACERVQKFEKLPISSRDVQLCTPTRFPLASRTASLPINSYLHCILTREILSSCRPKRSRLPRLARTPYLFSLDAPALPRSAQGTNTA